MDENRLLTQKEVGEYLKMGRDKTRALFELESFPCIKLGQTRMVFESDLIDWLKDQKGKQIYL